jgi:hypothetical protein
MEYLAATISMQFCSESLNLIGFIIIHALCDARVCQLGQRRGKFRVDQAYGGGIMGRHQRHLNMHVMHRSMLFTGKKTAGQASYRPGTVQHMLGEAR